MSTRASPETLAERVLSSRRELLLEIDLFELEFSYAFNPFDLAFISAAKAKDDEYRADFFAVSTTSPIPPASRGPFDSMKGIVTLATISSAPMTISPQKKSVLFFHNSHTRMDIFSARR